ncbi:MAG TPA: SdrD B-like domain-containing protein, partial [Gemmataceae bacterium]|nr:SdrD B-like domain-containing protein [Gemmataceae bacterium]
GGNTIFLQSTSTGMLDLYSGDGNNSIVLGSGGANSTVAGIVGAVTLDGGAGVSNTLTIENEGSAAANIVTVTPTTVGAAVGDSFFPAGGSLTYLDIQTLTIDTSNADPGDTITVFPSTTTTFNVNAGAPLPPTFPGDNLFINLTGITGATLNPTGVGTGNWSFSNAQPVNFTGIEKQDNVTRLAGEVFQDVNGNGALDTGDTGISGVTVTLFDSGNNQVAQTITDSSGDYQFFAGIGTYHVVETLPSGVIQTTPPPPSVTINFGTPDVTNLDFGNFTLVTIGGQVFQDINGNGVDDSGEPGLQGWTVELETTTGVVEQTTTTDVNGDYSFANLQPGTYRVREVGQGGWLQTTGDPTDFVTASGVNQTSVNFGNFQLITIGGELFNDLNGNGVLDGNESGVAGWSVDLFLNGAPTATTTTDTNGDFSFANLTPGTYRVRVELQTNWVTTNTPADIPASSGQNQTSVDLGVFQQFTLSGEVYFDANANGVLDSGETGLQGWTVYLDTNGNGQFDPGEPSAITDANGDYSFTNLGPGDYKVREVLQAGFAQTGAPPTDIIGQSGLDQTGNIGNFQIVTISGQVFNDLNGNGSNETGDTGLQGWTVFLDANGNGQLDPGEMSTTTDSNGDFSFQVAFTGTVRLAEVVQSGWVQTTTQSPITLQAGLIVSQDIGNFQTVSITSQVFVDLNGNGNNDGGTEPGKDGVQISLYADVNNNGVFDPSVDTLVATTTSATVGSQDGIYSFTGVTPGAYFLVEAPVPGSAQSDPPLPGYYSFTVQSGTNITDKNFGNLNGQTPSFLAAVYLDLFDRRIDSGGLTYWSAVLNRGVSRELVVHELAASLEGYTDEINNLYEQYLGRSADPAGLAYSIKLLSTQPPPNGFTPQELVKDLLLGSSEYFATQADQSNSQWVTTMYHAVTGSNPNASTASFLLGELNSGMDRGTVAIQALRSNPAYDFVVENYYQQILKRAADPGGLAFFVGTLQNGGQEEDIQQTLLGSDEYFSSL